MRLGKRILGLLAGIMCFGALASCQKEKDPEKPVIETIYVANATTQDENSWKEYTLENLNEAKVLVDNGTGIVICFKPNKDIKVVSISMSFDNVKNLTNLDQATIRTYRDTKKTNDRVNLLDEKKGSKVYDNQVTLSSNFTVTLNEEVTTDKYFHFTIYEGGDWSNIRLNYTEK